MSSRYLSHYLETTSTSANIGQATETDTAQPIGRLKSRVIGQALDTQTAQPVTGSKSRTLGLAAETDTAQTVGPLKSRSVGQAAETDTVQALSGAKQLTLGQAVETDTVPPLDLPVAVPVQTGGWWPLVAILHEIRTERARDTGQPAVLDDWDRHATAARRYRPGRRLVAPVARRVPAACPNDGEPLVRGPNGVLRCPFDGWSPDAF